MVLAYEPENIKPGWVALVVVLALAVATYFLWRSMNKQLDKIDVPTQQEIRDAESGGPSYPRQEGDRPREEDLPPGS